MKIWKWIKNRVHKNHDNFIIDASGVIHIGANIGQEGELYHYYDLTVVWVEPIPEVFEVLKKNIAVYEKQIAYQYLITDKNNEEYTFNIASNFGASSSILDLKEHKDIWPHVHYEKSIELKSITLQEFVNIEKIDVSNYNTLVMDTQGSELLVLKGAGDLLSKFKYIKAEVSDFEAYENCCQVDDIEKYLNQFGFKELSRKKFATRENGGSYFDIVYKCQR